MLDPGKLSTISSRFNPIGRTEQPLGPVWVIGRASNDKLEKSRAIGSYLGFYPLRWVGPSPQVRRVNHMHGDPNASGLGSPEEQLEALVGLEKCRKE